MFQPALCNSFHDVLMMSIYVNSIVVLNIHDVDYCFTIVGIAKGQKFIKKC